MSIPLPVYVLVAPLDWGLGHATRCVPIIKTLEDNGITVLVAAGGSQKILLRAEFPHLEFCEIPGYEIRFAGQNRSLVWGLILRIPHILKSIRGERAWLNSLCRERQIDAIVSDNRYGLYHKNKPCIFITHQLFIQSGLGNFANRILRMLNYRLIRRFSECWVPDFDKAFWVAGILSHPARMPPVPVKYIGILSRFRSRGGKDFSNPLLILISGPEPQRSLFEEKLFSQLNDYKGPAVVVRGLPGNKEEKTLENKGIEIYNHLPAESLEVLLNRSEIVVCRSGYSTVMDLVRLGKKAILVPTPGQPEQEYLGRYLQQKQWAYTVKQKDFHLEEAMKAANERGFGFPVEPGPLFPQAVAGFFNRLNPGAP